MSLKSGRTKSTKARTSELSDISESPNFATITIDLSNIRNLKYLAADDEDTEFVIVGKFLSNGLVKLEDQKFSNRFIDHELSELKFKFQVNVDDDEEVFNLFTQPAQC